MNMAFVIQIPKIAMSHNPQIFKINLTASVQTNI